MAEFGYKLGVKKGIKVMKINKNILLLLSILGLLPLANLAMDYGTDSDDEGYHTPVEQIMRYRRKRRLPARSESSDSELEDPTYIPGTPPQSERKRIKVHKNAISKRTVEAWPAIWERHEDSQEFMENLAQETSKTGETLLHKAMHLSPGKTPQKVACTRALIRAGADLTATTKDGDTPLHCWAMRHNSSQEEVAGMSTLLRHCHIPEDESVRNSYGSTPLHVVCSQGLINFKKFKIFVDAGIQLGKLNCNDETILHRLAQAGPDSSHNKPHILGLLQGCDLSSFINQRDYSQGRTALHWAVKTGDRICLISSS